MYKEIKTTIEDIKRFHAFIKTGETEDACWGWTGTKVRGYASMMLNGKQMYGHRISFFIHNGWIDNTKLVCHSCDNPVCTNPKHLFLGTNKDNRQDAMRKDRVTKGSYIHLSKLNESQVAEIKPLLATHTNVALGRRYSVNERCISDIRVGRTWKHVNSVNHGGVS